MGPRRTHAGWVAAVLVGASIVAATSDAAAGAPTLPAVVSEQIPIALRGAPDEVDIQGKPPIATDGTNFLVVWRTGVHGAQGDVYAARVTTDGALLDDPPIAVRVTSDFSGYPAVAFDGTDFLAVWAESPDGVEPWELRGQRIASDGTLVGDALTLTSTADLKPWRQLGIAFGSSGYLVTFRTTGDAIRAVRITTSGANLDGAGVDVGSGFYPAVAFDGSRFLVVFHDTAMNVAGRFVAETGVADGAAPFTISDETQSHEHSSVAFNGTHYLVAWYDWRPNDDEFEGSAYYARVATDGTVLDAPAELLSERVRGQVPVQVTTDGADFLAVWGAIKSEAGDFRHIDVNGRRIATDGSFVDDQPIGIATGAWHEWGPVVGTLGSHILVAWTGLADYSEQTWGIIGQIVDTSVPAPTAPTGTTGAGGTGWTDLGPLPTAFVSSILSFAPDDVYAFGEGEAGWNGGVFHDDGTGWAVEPTPTDPMPNINRKWGIASFDADEIWAIGYGGGGLRRRDGAWAPVTCCNTSETRTTLALGAWTDGSNVWTVNVDGEVWRGSNVDSNPVCVESTGCWDPEDSGTLVDLADVWGVRGDDLLAVGERGTIIRRNGDPSDASPATWTPEAGVPTSQRLNALDGSAADDVWVVGDAGTILHFDGVAWEPRASGTLADLLDVWVARPDDVWAVGMSGTILHYDGSGWWQETSGTSLNLTAVGGVVDAGSGTEHIWVGDEDRARAGQRSIASGLWTRSGPVAGAPVARRDAYTLDEDVPLVVAAPGLLANDGDPDGDALATIVEDPPLHGTVAVAADGSFTYTPDANDVRPDWFTYRVSDGVTSSTTVLVRLAITPVNDAPVAEPDGYLLPNLGPELHVEPAAGVLGNDWDVEGDEPLTALLAAAPAHGTLEFSSDGSFVYTRDSDFLGGTDTFSYRASDGMDVSEPGTVTIEVEDVPPPPPPANRAPTARDDVGATAPGTPVDIDVVANDTDPDAGDVLSISTTAPAHGQVAIVGGGSGGNVARYTPAVGFEGIDAFTYTARDQHGAADDASVHVAVGEHAVAQHAGSLQAGGHDPSSPVHVTVIAPNAMPLALSVHEVDGGVPAGWRGLGWAADVHADTTTASDPLHLDIQVHASLLPPADDPNARTVFRDGVPVARCDAPGAAPDPCVSAVTAAADGSVTFAVLTSAASTWTVGVAPTGRMAGPSRVETSTAVSRALFGSAEAAVLARADDFADALAGAPLAASIAAPLLLTDRTGLHAAVATELQRLGVTRVVLLGGPSALYEEVATGVRSLGIADVERIGGTDRFDTARLIGGRVGGSNVYVALGNHADGNRAWPDALAVAALAGYQRRPLLLTTTDALPAATGLAMAELGVDHATFVGGNAAISPIVEADVAARGVTTDRIAGPTRYETSTAAGDRMLGAGMDPVRVWFASGANWPDALSAGPAAAQVGAPLLLVHPTDLSGSVAVADWLRGHDPTVDDLVLAGGNGAVSTDVEFSLRAIIAP